MRNERARNEEGRELGMRRSIVVMVTEGIQLTSAPTAALGTARQRDSCDICITSLLLSTFDSPQSYNRVKQLWLQLCTSYLSIKS